MEIAGSSSLPFACYVTGSSPARSSSAGPLALTRDERSVLAIATAPATKNRIEGTRSEVGVLRDRRSL